MSRSLRILPFSPRFLPSRQGPTRRCYPWDMSRSSAEVLEAALALPEEQRAEVAEKLLASLDGELDADAESEWIARGG